MSRTFTISDVAAALKVHHETIRSEIKRKRLMATRVGKIYVITMPDLERYLGEERARAIFEEEE